MLKKQKRESRKPKNVLSEFKSEDISGHKFEDLDSVLQVRNMSCLVHSFLILPPAESWGSKGGEEGESEEEQS